MGLKVKRISSMIMAIIVVFLMIPANIISAIPPVIIIDVWDGSAATGFASGTGSEANPYIISTPSQLAFLAQSVNSGNTYSGKYIKLTSNIVLNYTDNWKNWDTIAPLNTWTPIGSNEKNARVILTEPGIS